jgi:hypothetical protein
MLAPEDCAIMTWGNRQQTFRWVNEIDYSYDGDNKNQKCLKVNVVVCEEKWIDIDPKTGEQVTLSSRHAWISSALLTKRNLHERCNLGARHRWNIEEEFLVEKRQGYQYKHLFSENWNAMKGYHYLMHLGHALNALAHYSEALCDVVIRMGIRYRSGKRVRNS